jgi:hypothetical protein
MNSSLIQIENGVLIIGDKHIELSHPVAEVKEWKNYIIVRVEPPVEELFNRNVFAFTKEGDCVWQIEESPHGTEKDKPYVGIFVDDRDNLIAANWNGVDYSVDTSSGKISTKAFNK